MKKFILIGLIALFATGLFAQTDPITQAVDEAIRVVVVEYEKKLADKDLIIVDKDIAITNATAERDVAVAKAEKFEKLYNLEKLNSRNKGLIIVGTGVAAFLIGYGACSLTP